jgi:hypothetical protein
LFLYILLSQVAFPQTAQQVQSIQKSLEVPRTTCPGDPPANLASYDCNFTKRLRVKEFVSGSVTDGAILSATFFGAVAHLQRDPGEWKRDWSGFGYRVGSRYGQGLAKGLAELTFGSIMKADPRDIDYASDPGVHHKDCGAGVQDCQPKVSSRIGHAFLNWLTVRRSTLDGNGKRMPNIPLFAGAAASGFVGNAWYPAPQATAGQAAIRGSYSLGTALAYSFYNEFSPEIGRALGALFKQGKTPAAKAVPPSKP